VANPETVADLNMIMVRDYATKDQVATIAAEVTTIKSEVSDATITSAIIINDISHVRAAVDNMQSTLTWIARTIIGALLGGAVIGAGYFLAASAGLL
jgi:hypothetical protein